MMLRFLSLVTMAAGIGGMAILSVQNATPVVLNFLFFQSIALPLGIVLAVAVVIGLFVPLLLLWGLG